METLALDVDEIRQVSLQYKGISTGLTDSIRIGRGVTNDIVIENVSQKQCELFWDGQTGIVTLRVYSKGIGVHLIRKGANEEEPGEYLKLEKTDTRNFLERVVEAGDSLFFKDTLNKAHWIEVKEQRAEKQRSKAEWIRLILEERLQMEQLDEKIDALNRRLFQATTKKRKIENTANAAESAETKELRKGVQELRSDIDSKEKDCLAAAEELRRGSEGQLNHAIDLQHKYQTQLEAIQGKIREITWSSDVLQRPQFHPDEAAVLAQSGRHVVQDPNAAADEGFLPEEDEDDYQKQMEAAQARAAGLGQRLLPDDDDDDAALDAMLEQDDGEEDDLLA